MKRYIKYILLIAAGIFLGWLFFHTPEKSTPGVEQVSQDDHEEIWTCSMHPQIRMHEPGKCPLCGMDLIPLGKNTGGADSQAIHLTREAAALANVQTTIVSKDKAVKEIRLYGRVQADERLLQSQVSHIPGRIEKLLVNFTGETIKKGQTLALIYSPELVTAQQELLEAAEIKNMQPEIYEAARERLRLWKISEDQINDVEKTGKVQTNVGIVSNTSGIVISRRVNNGDHVAEGTVLFEIADLSRVWVMFDAYESDLPFLKKGDRIEFTVQAVPGKKFTQQITFIDPVIDPVTRVAKVRVETVNPANDLKPEMFVTGISRSAVLSDQVIIPGSAVLWTGTRSIVYVKQAGSDEPVFNMREVELGLPLGNSYIVKAGLEEGEEIVTNGTFSVDAAAQLEGKISMMNPEGEVKPSEGHIHGNIGKEESPLEGNPGMKNTDSRTGANAGHASFKVSGNCEMCKERIEAAAKSVSGVSSAEWDAASNMIHVTFEEQKASLIEIHKAIANAGHDTEKAKARDEVYNKLPDCCKYTRK